MNNETVKIGEELKPCPMCGKQPHVEISGRDILFYAVACNNCITTCYAENKQDVINQWNTRADSSRIESLEKENERLKKALEVYADEKSWCYWNGEEKDTWAADYRHGYDLAKEVLGK